MFILIISCNPSEEQLVNKGKALMKQEKYKEAMPWLQRALKKNSNNSLVLNMIGVAHFEQEQVEESVPFYLKAAEVDSINYKPFFNLGNAYYELGNAQEALRNFNKAIDLQGNIPDIYINRAVILQKLSFYQEALYDLQFAQRLDDTRTLVYYNQAEIYYSIDSLDRATDMYTITIERAPDFAKAYYGLGLTEIKKGFLDKACRLLRRSEKLGFDQAKQAVSQYCG